jgi:hypothetical protein
MIDVAITHSTIESSVLTTGWGLTLSFLARLRGLHAPQNRRKRVYLYRGVGFEKNRLQGASRVKTSTGQDKVVSGMHIGFQNLSSCENDERKTAELKKGLKNDTKKHPNIPFKQKRPRPA